MRFDAMMPFARHFFRVRVNEDERQILEMVQQLMPRLHGDRVRIRHRDLRGQRNIQLGMQAVSEPAGTNLGHFFYFRDMLRDMADFVDNVWIDPVQHSREYLFAALDHDFENRDGDQQPDEWIGEREAKPYAKHSDEHRQTGPAVDPRMMAIRDKRGTADPPSDADAENRDRFIAHKTDRGCGGNRCQMRYFLRMAKSIEALVAGNDRAEKIVKTMAMPARSSTRP